MSAIDLSNFLHQRAETLSLSATIISKKAGISRQTWYRLLNAEVKQARVETLIRVADILQVNFMELSALYTQKQAINRKPLISSVGSDSCSFIRDVNCPLNTMVYREELSEKKWEILNSGNSTWINRTFICVDEELDIRLKQGDQNACSGESSERLTAKNKRITVPLTEPGEHVVLSAWFYAPKTSGTVISFWKVIDEQGEYCFPEKTGLSCQVRVVERAERF